ncbi:hypothetical protein D6V26_07035 [Vibrio cholerae]|uniref:hypothetical protein n=1 Tax=Vibrio cholerae TaxID=666 RepID=UPI000E684A13|nr:hypothetical protein [Vibrio cholerae]MVC37388.1 hypothetical protein [Vibrio cholerae]
MKLLPIFNSLGMRAKPVLKPVKTYVIWSPSYVMQVTGKKASTYEELQAIEETDNVSVSSQVEVVDINQIIQAFLNETNHEMLYQEI